MSTQSYNQNPAAMSLALEPEQFNLIRSRIAEHSGFYLDRTGRRAVTLAVAQRLAATKLTIKGYLRLINSAAAQAELQSLAELLLNHETLFFRNQVHLEALRTAIIPQLHRTKPAGKPLHIWSAGCSTGEEAYSLAMITMECLGNPPQRPFRVWGTDLSTTALTKARRGIYQGRTLNNLSTNITRRYLRRAGSSYAVNEQVREVVTFEQHNLLNPFPSWASSVDLIFCQNVTIYFQLETFRQLAERFYKILPSGGMLFLGFSETLWNVFDGFRLCEIGGSFVYVKEPEPTKSHQTGQVVTPTARTTNRSLKPAATAPLRPIEPAEPVLNNKVSRRLLEDRETRPLPPIPYAPPGSFPDQTVQIQAAMERGQVLLHQGKASVALGLLSQLPLHSDLAPRILVLMAQAHANIGDIDLALAEAHRALELDTLSGEAYRLLGLLSLQQGQFQEATQQLERARYLCPDIALISFHLAEAYRQLKRYDSALREYRNTLRKLTSIPADSLLEGVAVGWLRATCQQHIRHLEERK